MKKRSLLSMPGLLLAVSLTISCSILEEARNAMSDMKETLTSGLLSTAGLQFMPSEEIPEGSESIITGVQFIAADATSPYGTLIFTSSKELDALFLQVAGEDGYYVKMLTPNDIANRAGGEYGYSVDLDFAPGLDAESKKILVSGRSTQGTLSITKESQNTTIEKRSCSNSSVSGGYAGFIGSFDMGVNSGSFEFEYQTYTAPDEITVYGDAKAREPVLFHYPSGGTDGWKKETIYFWEPIISIKVVGSSSGTQWHFKVHCP